MSVSGAQDFTEFLNQLGSIPPEQLAAVRKSYLEEQAKLDLISQRALREEELKTAQHLNQILADNSVLRAKYAKKIFNLTLAWTFGIFLVVLLQGFNNYDHYYLSDKVLITLITSTTINLFGFFLLVVKYLFHVEARTDKLKAKAKAKQAGA